MNEHILFYCSFLVMIPFEFIFNSIFIYSLMHLEKNILFFQLFDEFVFCL